MQRTRLFVPKMDCGAEERLVRLALSNTGEVTRVEVDLAHREVTAFHDNSAGELLAALGPLASGAELLETAPAANVEAVGRTSAETEVKTLWIAFGINAAMFLGESVGGYIADSSALIADSLDMFADAAVYGIALYGAGRAVSGQRRAANISGWLQLGLAGGALLEVTRRALRGSEPEPALMMVVALVALAANATTMWLLARHRHGGAHMKASWIFTTNDVFANLGVIAGGVLVQLTGSSVPDLFVGAVIGFVVLSGAIRILRLSRAT